MHHADRDLLPFLPFQNLDGIVHRHLFGRLAVDFHDRVPRPDAGFVGGRSREGRSDRQPPAVRVDRHLDADAAEFLLDLHVELRQVVGADVIRIGIELFHHSPEGRFDQLAAIDVFDVIAFDLLERVGEDPHQLEVLVFLGQRLGGIVRRFGLRLSDLFVVIRVVVIVIGRQECGPGQNAMKTGTVREPSDATA